MSFISAKKLCKNFYRGKFVVEAIQKLDLDIEQGESIAVTGRSGSGKSTLLNMIGGLERPSSGELLFDGMELSSLSETELTKFRREKIGFIFQRLYLQNHLTALENCTLPLKYNGVKLKERNRIGTELLEKMGLSERLSFYPQQLSGGELRRVAIARALATKPQLLIADEPNAELDSQTSDEVMNLILDVARKNGLTLILATHDQSLAARCKRKLVLKSGVLISES